MLKTLLARAIAQAISIKGIGNAKTVSGSFISLKASDIVRPEIGNSEKLIVSAFDSARANAPSVVFIDEFQVSDFNSSCYFMLIHNQQNSLNIFIHRHCLVIETAMVLL